MNRVWLCVDFVAEDVVARSGCAAKAGAAKASWYRGASANAAAAGTARGAMLPAAVAKRLFHQPRNFQPANRPIAKNTIATKKTGIKTMLQSPSP